MLRNWYYSLAMLITYVSVFLYWKQFPSRLGFLLAGLAVVLGLTLGLIWAWRRRYFVNRVTCACMLTSSAT